jgi:hypothetical protein
VTATEVRHQPAGAENRVAQELAGLVDEFDQRHLVPPAVSLGTAWKVAVGEERSAFASAHWPELVAVLNAKD